MSTTLPEWATAALSNGSIRTPQPWSIEALEPGDVIAGELVKRTKGTVTIRVTSRTRFERVSFSSLRAGARNIEATVHRSNGRWVASEVERSGGGGHHGGDDD